MFDIKHTACNTVHRCNEVIYHIENRDFFILIYTKTEAVFEIDGCKQIVEHDTSLNDMSDTLTKLCFATINK